jgi:hypothetical protein
LCGLSDEVFLKNGAHLTGTVKATKDGKLVLETSYSGEWQDTERSAIRHSL